MKYIYFVRYSTTTYNGMCESTLSTEITNFDDIRGLIENLKPQLPSGAVAPGASVLIDNYILLRTESDD